MLRSQSLPTVILRTPFTWTIKFHRGNKYIINEAKKEQRKKVPSLKRIKDWKKIWDLINKRKCLIHWNLLGYLWHWCHQSVLPWRYIGDFGQKSAYSRTSFRITVPLKERNRKITGPSAGKRSCFRLLSKNVAGNCCRHRRSIAVHHQNMCF